VENEREKGEGGGDRGGGGGGGKEAKEVERESTSREDEGRILAISKRLLVWFIVDPKDD